MIDPETDAQAARAGTIEVAPLAYMRGRTLNDAFIILDEAQNTSPEQMKMFLTRLGFGSKMVVTGDVTQVDLPSGTRSGLRIVEEILTASRTSRSTGSPPTTWSATGWSGTSSRRTTSTKPAPTRRTRGRRPAPRARPDERRRDPQMSIEVLNESGADVDAHELLGSARFVMDRMRVHPLAELCIKLVDEATIAELNEQWMEKEGPTDVLAFPMDELRPGLVTEEPEEGVLGDLVLCPAVAQRQAEDAVTPCATRSTC